MAAAGLVAAATRPSQSAALTSSADGGIYPFSFNFFSGGKMVDGIFLSAWGGKLDNQGPRLATSFVGPSHISHAQQTRTPGGRERQRYFLSQLLEAKAPYRPGFCSDGNNARHPLCWEIGVWHSHPCLEVRRSLAVTVQLRKAQSLPPCSRAGHCHALSTTSFTVPLVTGAQRRISPFSFSFLGLAPKKTQV